jgi:urease accessory protein
MMSFRPNANSIQTFSFQVDEDSFCAVMPQPVTCFSQSRYIQKQRFDIKKSSNLLLVDWCTSGRMERGERWMFELYDSLNEVYVDGSPVLLDRVILQQPKDYNNTRNSSNYYRNVKGLTISERMGDIQAIGMIFMWGSKLEELCDTILNEVNVSNQSQLTSIAGARRKMKKCSLLASGSIITGLDGKKSGAIIRVASNTTEELTIWLSKILKPAEKLVGGNPYNGYH